MVIGAKRECLLTHAEESRTGKKMRTTSSLEPLVYQLSSKVVTTVIKAATTLSSFANNTNDKQSMLNFGVIPPLVDMLGSNNVQCKFVAMTLISTIIEGNHEFKTPMCDAGVLTPLVTMFHSCDMKCRVAALSLTAQFSKNRGFETRIADAGAIQPLIANLRSRDDCMMLALKIIGNIAFDNLELRIANAGAIPVIAEILSSNNDEAAALASVALWNLSAVHALRTQMVDKSIMGPLLKSIQKLNDTHKLDGLGLLNNLVEVKELRQQIVDNGTTEVLIPLIYSKNTYCQKRAIRALSHLSVIESCAVQTATATASGRVIEALVQSLSSEDRYVVEQASRILCNIALMDRFESLIIEANALVPLVSILSSHTDTTCQNTASAVLQNISFNTADALILVENLFPTLANGLMHEEEEIRNSCYSIFRNIHKYVRVNPALHLLQGTISMLRTILLNHKDQPLVYECFQLAVLKPYDLGSAMSLLSTMLSTGSIRSAVNVCTGIMMSCEYPFQPNVMEPSLLTNPLYRSMLRTTFNKAFEMGGTCAVDMASAIAYIMRVVDIRRADTQSFGTPTQSGWEDMSVLRTNDYLKLADFVCKVEHTDFHVHKTILAMRSPYFESLVRTNMSEQASNVLVIRDCHPSVFGVLLTFLYSGTLSDGMLAQHNAQDVLIAADRFQIAPLREAVEAYLFKQLDASNAILMWQLAVGTNAVQLQAACMHFILINFGDIVKLTEIECTDVRQAIFDACFEKMESLIKDDASTTN